MMFLFFPVLRRGSYLLFNIIDRKVSILPRLATGIILILHRIPLSGFYSSPSCDGDLEFQSTVLYRSVSILPRLATGIGVLGSVTTGLWFLFFPVLRRGSVVLSDPPVVMTFLFFPVLRRGSTFVSWYICCFSFYSSPSCDGDRYRFCN